MPQSIRRLLYIDDDAGLCRLAQRNLSRRGFDVTSVHSGEEGVALATREKFDLIAVDHYMPGMNGLETLAALRALPSPPPVVYVTGSEEGPVAVAALRAGAADYVVKTVGEDFFDLLGAALDQVRERAALERDKALAEEQLRASNARLEALLREVNHRVANSLQLVTAMVRLQSNSLADPAAREILANTERRIEAIAQVHRNLYASDDASGVDMKDYLQALVAELGEAWASDEPKRSLHLSAESIRLPADRAVSLGVIVNELVSNAFKYAYGPTDAGEVRVSLQRESEHGFVLAVEDDGVGLGAVPRTQGSGLGSRLIGAMAKSLRGAVEYDSGGQGVRATLRAGIV
ncbi:MAG: response regulator [Sphingomonas sp.]|uniref:sensor histidine kinase n=1 Tax=Sphingomonas sp. TaxID=28214 RepID=UPI001AC676BE|nr:histidine kinase dimerization/phosphoacceptor domain -containing protein [Sphingomonas sp.]MBN8809068.1 response regulator [Sphingomonas sp.]